VSVTACSSKSELPLGVTVVLNENLSLCTTEMHMGEWRYYSLILNLRTGQGLVISFTAYCAPVKQPHLVWLQSQYGCFGEKKNALPARIRTLNHPAQGLVIILNVLCWRLNLF